MCWPVAPPYKVSFMRAGVLSVLSIHISQGPSTVCYTVTQSLWKEGMTKSEEIPRL